MKLSTRLILCRRKRQTTSGIVLVAALGCPFIASAAAQTGAPVRTAPGVEAAGMVQIAATEREVGSSPAERMELAKRFACDPTWFNDDLDKHTARLPAFWIDRTPISNRQYGEYVVATGGRAPWPGGWYAAETADHPVVDINHVEAAAYAAWAGKRLPTAEEWEVAVRSERAGLFPWGNDWPGPVQSDNRAKIPDWRAPATDRLGTRRHGESAAGMEDFIQQVCEWTGTTRPHHGTTFVAVKGSSWLQSDPVEFRTAATSWAMASFATPWIGFRCALDGDRQPVAPPSAAATATTVRTASLPQPASLPTTKEIQVWPLRDAPEAVAVRLLDWTKRFLEAGRPAGSPPLRGFLLQSDALGAWPVALFLAEAMYWKGAPVLSRLGEVDPMLQVGKNPTGRPRYSLHFPELDVTFEFVAGRDCVDLVTQVTNRSTTDGEFLTSSCFSLTNHPLFYDCEMLRTYLWTRDRGFVSLRQIPRPGDCIRWITSSESAPFGGPGVPGTMAVVSRDGYWTFASARLEGDATYRLSGNTWLNCLHTDAAVMVAAQATRTTRQRLYFLPGGLAALEARLRNDRADGAL